ncbi:MAG TPA: calcium-binding protein [Solirubrobacterales bacterium]
MKRLRTLATALTLLCLLGAVLAVAGQAVRGLGTQRAVDGPHATCAGKRATIATRDRTIHGTKAPDVIVTGRGPDVIHGAGGNDVICGGAGRDVINGDRGKDRLFGMAADDVLHGGRGSDDLDGGEGSDRVSGNTGNDQVDGGPGDGDKADGGPGDDDVGGGSGDFDTVLGGIGNDSIDGGPGSHDIASYENAGGAIDADLVTGVVEGAEQETLAGIEDVLGGAGDDTLAASDTDTSRLDGGPGDDLLLGVTPDDQAFGGPGSDECVGEFAVEDSCGVSEAGGGTEVVAYEGITDSSSVAITGGDQDDDVTVAVEGGSLTVSSASGDSVPVGGADTIVADLGGGDDRLLLDGSVPAGVSVTIDGGPGSDWLRGGAGDDTFYSGDDRLPDRLEGGDGDDALFGVNIFHPRRDSGAATMLGGGGDDLLIGGQPCNGDLFDGGGGAHDSASFARVNNEGTAVVAKIGGAVSDPDVAACTQGRIDGSVEKIEGSPGPDLLFGSSGPEVLLGRGGEDMLDGLGGQDRCIGGRGESRIRRCEFVRD